MSRNETLGNEILKNEASPREQLAIKMPFEFRYGRKLVAIVITIHLFVSAIAIYITHEFVLPHLPAILATLSRLKPFARHEELLQQITSTTTTLWTEQGVNYAYNIFWSAMLFWGFDWVRWLWGSTWLVISLIGIAASFIFYANPALQPLFWTLLIVSLVYFWCSCTILFSPSVRKYMEIMRS